MAREINPTQIMGKNPYTNGSEAKGSGFMSEGLGLETNDSTDEIVALKDVKDAQQESLQNQPLVAFVKERFQRAKDKRFLDEQRWIRCYRNFRGLYGPDVAFTDTEKSRAFIKITKTKVLAAFAQITDILFSGNKFPIGIEASMVPEGIAEAVHIDTAGDPSEQNAGGGSPLIRKDILDALGPFKDKLEPVKDKLKEGAGTSATSSTWEPAKEAAKRMDKKIQDQLDEANADKSLRSFVFEMCLLGTGIYKGPFARDKEYPKWTPEGEYIPVIKQIADVEYVSVWDSYPDADAANMGEAEWFIQRHKLSKSDLRALKKRPYFRSSSIDAVIKDGWDYIEEYWESTIKDYYLRQEIERFEVLEYWGIADKDFVEETEMEIPKQFKDKDEVQVNIWVCNGHVIRAVFNPYTPTRIPYLACPYELNPYSFFGIGIAENMEDTQLLMNGFMRLAVDNAVLSSNVVLEVNENNLVPGQDLKISPGKIIRTQGAQGQSIWTSKIENRSQEALSLFDKARQLADEATGMPSYAHGQGGIQGIGRTASGMSMLMGAAAQNIKSVVKNIDDYLLVPLGRALFAFNMQFDFDKDFVGDLEVVAKGTTSLMRNEVRSQKLLQFLEMTNNPNDTPFVKRDYLLRELAESLDLEADKTVNDPRDAMIQAERQKELMQAQGIDPNKQAQGQGAPQAPSSGPQNPAGGNSAPPPGAQGFSGGGGGTPQAAQAASASSGGRQPQ